ncbi:hypothetical protein [Guggenheimella bovis]
MKEVVPSPKSKVIPSCEWIEWVYVIRCPHCGQEIVLSEENKIKNGIYECGNKSCEGHFGVKRVEGIPSDSIPRRARYKAQLIEDNDRVFKQQIQQCFSTGQSKGEIRQDVSPGALRLYFCMIQGILNGILLYPKEPFDLGNTDELFEAYWDGIRANGTD